MKVDKAKSASSAKAVTDAKDAESKSADALKKD